MNESQVRGEICRIGKSLFDRGYAHATAGNISVRLDDGCLITPTDACLGFLDPSRLSRIDGQGRHIGGDRPSKTLSMHARIVEAALAHDPGTRCVLHTHSSHCVSLSMASPHDELLAPITPYFVMKVGHVPHLRYHRPGSAEAVQAVVQSIHRYGAADTPIRAVMLARLGPMVWHDSPASAMAVLEELEETARLTLRAGTALQALDPASIEDLRKTFGARW